MNDQPLTARELLDAGFLENRARVLEIAAFLDRIDRAPGAGSAREDFRYRALRRAVGLLLEQGDRTRTIQLSLSDQTREPIADARGLKALGAWEGKP